MIQTLRIRNYALIDDIEIEFREGLNVLTGETGAGKSIIVGALNLILGARASADAVRSGEKQAHVEAVFHLTAPASALTRLLEEHGIELEDGLLYISRIVSAAGRSRAYAGGALVPLAVLSALGDELVDLHGQHEHQSLLHSGRQLDLLDAFAGTTPDAQALSETVRQLRVVERERAQLEEADRELERRVDFIRFESNEIDKAQLESETEIDELKQRRDRAAHAETIATLTNQAQAVLSDTPDESSALDRLNAAERCIDELAELDQGFAPLRDRLARTREEIAELAGELALDLDSLALDPAELDAIHARLDLIANLKRKYGDTVEAILEYQRGIQEEIDRYDNRDAHADALQKQHDTLLNDAGKQAKALTQKRKQIAKKLEKSVAETLQFLGMEGAKFQVAIEPGELTTRGADKVEFQLAANAGEPSKPLRQVASGGEISRVMLALKATFAGADAIPTLIFDEIDSGVGGAVATSVAEKLRALGNSHQVICITHLPQIAAAGFTHFHVSKAVEDQRTETHVTRVEEDSRVREVARLLDGTITEISLKHAESLLRETAG